MSDEILKYYNDLAATYDDNRFANSYGKYIHQQESAILKRYLDTHKKDNTIDIACGTGRFLEFANTGVDFSPEMVKVSQSKFPQKIIKVSDAKSLVFENTTFNNAIAFHLFMHLNTADLKSILKETHRVLKDDGRFIFDIPSKKRRHLTRYKAKNWHGGFQISTKELKDILENEWELVNYHGIGFFPIHHLPKRLRKYFRWLDSFFCNSFLKEYSSHLIFILKKK